MQETKYLISREEILMGRDKQYPLSQTQEENLAKLLASLNKFRQIYGKPMNVSSGYRPAQINAKVGGAKISAHLECLACDFHDPDGLLDEFCIKNIKILEECNLYLEDPKYTKGWCHLQIRKPTSRRRIFKP